jgi:hypothetical protein
MEKMSTGAAWAWFSGGVGLFALGTLLAFVLPFSKKITPPESAKQFFTPAQYAILYGQNPKFDPENPNPKFVLTKPSGVGRKTNSPAQTTQLANWDFGGCVQTDGTAAQSSTDSACFCEKAPAVRAIFDGGWAVQPQNTLSAASLSIVGLTILGLLVFLDPPERKNFMTLTYFFALCYAAMTILLGPLSMMLHLGLRNLGGWFDSLSLYVWFSFVACYAWFRFIARCLCIRPENFPFQWWIGLLFGIAWLGLTSLPAGLTFPGVNSPIPNEVWYVILGAVALLGELFLVIWNHVGTFRSPATSWAPDGKNGWSSWWLGLLWSFPPRTGGSTLFLAGGITFALALTIWILSWTQKPLCAPTGLQGHAIFHCLSAVALALLYKYYRQEGEVPARGD